MPHFLKTTLAVAAIAFALANDVFAQAPDLLWDVRLTDKDQDACLNDADAALKAGKLYHIAPGSKEGGARYTAGSNSNMRAVIACSKGANSVAAVMVAGSVEHLADTRLMSDFLAGYMDGKREEAPQLAESEEPVEMNVWLSTNFCLGCDGMAAEERYSGDIVRPARSIRVRVFSGVSEDGDGAVEVLVYDPNKRLVLTEQSKLDDWAEWRVGVIDYGRYELVLRSIGATGTPGSRNEGQVQVLVR